MAEATQPPNVKLLCGMISARKELFDEAAQALEAAFGPVDSSSDVMDFDFTHYYDQQMGSPLYRRFLSFQRLISPESLIEAKWTTNALEHDFAARVSPGSPPRPINLDPGYIDHAKLVLASMKDFSHRLYLGRSVFAEVTLMYRGPRRGTTQRGDPRKGAWQPLPWTFPDYASQRYHPFLTVVRRRLHDQSIGENSP